MHTNATVTVIIATYNRAALLDECLTHLRTQRFLGGDEVIVVDNGSVDDTAATVCRHQAEWAIPLRLLHEPRAGKSHAIARARAVASGDVLVFTDDDVNVGAGWLDAIRRSMADPDVAMSGGPVEPRWEPEVPQWIRQARERHPRLGAPIALLDYGDQPVALGARTLLGANLAVRRDVFIRAGGFPTNLGKLRGTLLSGEDHELCRRVQAAGLRAMYAPDAVVHHWVPANRARTSYILRWFFWSGITHAIMDNDRAAMPGRVIARVPLYLVRQLGTAAARALGALLTLNRAKALASATDVAFALGYASRCWGVTARVAATSSRVGEPA
jgi:GT2 family glycosyltransferase